MENLTSSPANIAASTASLVVGVVVIGGILYYVVTHSALGDALSKGAEDAGKVLDTAGKVIDTAGNVVDKVDTLTNDALDDATIVGNAAIDQLTTGRKQGVLAPLNKAAGLAGCVLNPSQCASEEAAKNAQMEEAVYALAVASVESQIANRAFPFVPADKVESLLTQTWFNDVVRGPITVLGRKELLRPADVAKLQAKMNDARAVAKAIADGYPGDVPAQPSGATTWTGTGPEMAAWWKRMAQWVVNVGRDEPTMLARLPSLTPNMPDSWRTIMTARFNEWIARARTGDYSFANEPLPALPRIDGIAEAAKDAQQVQKDLDKTAKEVRDFDWGSAFG